MALSKLENLYRAVVAEHSRFPRHQGRIEDGQEIHLNNPTCGDVISLSFKVNEENEIEEIAFVNSGCSISTASASMMTELILNKSTEEALALAEIFSKMVQGESDDRQKDLGDAVFLAGVATFPQRIKCATLGWNALKKALENEGDGYQKNESGN